MKPIPLCKPEVDALFPFLEEVGHNWPSFLETWDLV